MFYQVSFLVGICLVQHDLFKRDKRVCIINGRILAYAWLTGWRSELAQAKLSYRRNYVAWVFSLFSTHVLNLQFERIVSKQYNYRQNAVTIIVKSTNWPLRLFKSFSIVFWPMKKMLKQDYTIRPLICPYRLEAGECTICIGGWVCTDLFVLVIVRF